ncbi:uncharacterized protein (DUF927 family) [Peribacillus sp. B2I2]|uniref:DUF927 domain-containing protein n=1 Tax=Peribacillus sp. B2I2 TaxID=3156468 RepID=UPI0035117D5E
MRGTATTRVFRVKGTVGSWIGNVFNLVKDHPKAVFPLFVSFASVILDEFDRKPIVVDVSGESSSGKSGLLLLCASVWGSPKEYIGSFNLTFIVAVERRSAFLNSYPQILDPFKWSKRHPNDSNDDLSICE